MHFINNGSAIYTFCDLREQIEGEKFYMSYTVHCSIIINKKVQYAQMIFISNLSDDRSTTTSKTIPPLNAI
jgi:hypothetical protein